MPTTAANSHYAPTDAQPISEQQPPPANSPQLYSLLHDAAWYVTTHLPNSCQLSWLCPTCLLNSKKGSGFSLTRFRRVLDLSVLSSFNNNKIIVLLLTLSQLKPRHKFKIMSFCSQNRKHLIST